MANTVYNVAKSRWLSGDLDMNSDTIKTILVEGTPTINADHATVAAVLAAGAELVCTGYTAGPGSASRKTNTMTVAQDDTNDRATAATNAQTWSTLSGGDVIRAYLIYEHVSGTDDTLNFPIAIVDTDTGLPLTTNGSDVALGVVTVRLT